MSGPGEQVEAAARARQRGDFWACLQVLRDMLSAREALGPAGEGAIALARAIGDDWGAVALARRVLDETAATANAAALLAETLTDAGRADEAVIALAPFAARGALNPEQTFRYSRMLMFAGKVEEAHACARALLKDRPQSAAVWERLAQTKTFTAGDPDIAAMQTVFDNLPSDKTASRILIAAALAKAMVDLGDDARADFYLRARAEATQRRFPFNAQGMRAALADIETWCASGRRDPEESSVGDGDRVTFILGPNRSGTTLVDQIYSRHPSVGGGGERRHFWLASSPLGDCSNARIDAFAAQSPDGFEELGRRYLALCDESFGAGFHVTDKLLSNVYRVRAIRRALPRAQIIYVRRNPLAVAWSCWRAQFDAESAWAGSPEGIALYLAVYRRAMNAWRQRFPEAVTTVDYESLVREPDAAIPRLLSASGLADDPATRAPHESKRAVSTLSFAQVRRPIHARGVDSVRNFPVSTAALARALDNEGLES